MLYIIGGRNNSSMGNTDSTLVDKYDPMKNEWTALAPLTYARNRVGVGVVSGHIYAVGGGNGSVYHSSVERYSPRANKWTTVASMSMQRIGKVILSLFIFESFILISQGFFVGNDYFSNFCDLREAFKF